MYGSLLRSDAYNSIVRAPVCAGGPVPTAYPVRTPSTSLGTHARMHMTSKLREARV